MKPVKNAKTNTIWSNIGSSTNVLFVSARFVLNVEPYPVLSSMGKISWTFAGSAIGKLVRKKWMCLTQDDEDHCSDFITKFPNWVYIPGIGTIDTADSSDIEEFYMKIQKAIDDSERAKSNYE